MAALNVRLRGQVQVSVALDDGSGRWIDLQSASVGFTMRSADLAEEFAAGRLVPDGESVIVALVPAGEISLTIPAEALVGLVSEDLVRSVGGLL